MDLAFTEEQGLLRETLRSLLQKYSSPEIVRELEDTDPGYRPDLWDELARQGLLGLTISEAEGGSGMTQLEQVILYEEFGRALTATAARAANRARGGCCRRSRAERRSCPWRGSSRRAARARTASRSSRAAAG